MHLQPRLTWSVSDHLLAWLFALQPYLCDRCSSSQRKFQPTWRVIVTLLLLSGLGGGASYLVKNPPAFGGAAPTGGTETVARSRNAMGGELTPFEQLMTRKPKQTLNNDTVIELWKAEIGSNVILQLIRTSNADYDLSPTAIIKLKKAGVDQLVILAMIDASSTSR